MQTFLPYRDFRKTASVLDRQRLGKQRVETMQIFKAFTSDSGWSNHPATKMWKGYGWALLQYQTAICNEWHLNRGYRDTCLRKTIDIYNSLDSDLIGTGVWPYWLNIDDFFRSHKSNLIRKKPDHYGPIWPDIPDDLEYIWPE